MCHTRTQRRGARTANHLFGQLRSHFSLDNYSRQSGTHTHTQTVPQKPKKSRTKNLRPEITACCRVTHRPRRLCPARVASFIIYERVTGWLHWVRPAGRATRVAAAEAADAAAVVSQSQRQRALTLVQLKWARSTSANNSKPTQTNATDNTQWVEFRWMSNCRQTR